MDSSRSTRFKILMFPWLAHGHIFPYLELAKRILTRRKNFHICVCSTPINSTSINNFIQKTSLQNSIEGFLDRAKERGIVVEGWAPQAKILAHQSVGGFVSHCGWSSINESLYFGVSIICMPFKLVMFIDSRMVVEEVVGFDVVRDENMVYKGEEIAKAIQKVLLEKTGEVIRLKAREIRDKMRMEEEQEMDAAAEELWQLCLKNNSVR